MLREHFLQNYLRCETLPSPLNLPLMALAVNIVQDEPIALKEYFHADLQKYRYRKAELVEHISAHLQSSDKRVLVAHRYSTEG